MRPTIAPRELIALLERHRGLYAAWTPTPELAWATPCVAQMAELMREIDVLPSRRRAHA
jgi:hypothetical protein